MDILLINLQKHNKQFRTAILALLSFLIFQTISNTAFGQFTVSPTIIEVRAYPGGIRTFTVSIGNSGKETLDCEVRVSAMSLVEGGLPVEVDDAPRSCRDWITVEQTTFRLAPGDGIRLVCRVQPPRDAAGGYYAIISCYGTPTSRTEESAAEGLAATVQFSHRALVPVLLTIPTAELKAIIEAGSPIITKREGTGGYKLKIPVRNQGNIHTRMNGTVRVQSEAGQLIDKFELSAGRGFILPQHERFFSGKVPMNLPDGIYVANIRLEAELSNRPMRNAFSFYIKDGLPSVQEISDELRAQLMAQSVGFTVVPPQMQVMLRPGSMRSQPVELINLTRETISLRAELMEWYRGPDGKDIVSDEQPPHKRSGKVLLNLKQQEFELSGLSRRRIPVVFSLPKEAAGDKYASVTFERTDVSSENSLKTRLQRSVLIRTYAQGTGTADADITQFEAVHKPNGVVDLCVRFSNTGDISITPEASFRITDKDGNSKGNLKPEALLSFVQAGSEGVIKAQWTRVLDAGDYIAELSFRIARNKVPLIKRTEFTVPKIGVSGPEKINTPAYAGN